ncbi:TRAP transporter substrate-binding protein DctP [Sporosarcina ureilytica]|uniref:ABC transporter substrate-binding protein n=1 Tax=Sporosarcina ureilytica TaxID=298596 RepID=A0A1D8JFJ4_9BACL|nr:TRAP transporter substrate-binding protein DctP [Sporosarcina ureilytica]AOV07480.1 hypothetical protein BI350_07985 [Sporosarcina ureilytica]
MNKRLITLLSSALIVLLTLTACLEKEAETQSASSEGSASETSNKKFTWKYSTIYAEGSIQYERDKRFKELVEALSNGQMELELHPVGVLSDAGQLLDTVSEGTIEIGGDWPGTWSGRNTAFSLLGTQTGLTAFDYIMWIEQGGGRDVYNEIYGQYNLVYFPYNAPSNESGIRTNEPIRSLEDLKGKNIRFVGTVQERVLQKLGGNPMNVPAHELYEAVQRGVIDGLEFAGPAGDRAMNFHEVTDYVAAPGWHQTASVTGVMINKDAWETLPDHLKNVIEVASKTTMFETTFKELYMDAEASAEMAKAGIEVNFYPEEDLEKVQGIIGDVLDELAVENKDFAKVLDSQSEFMSDYAEYREMQKPWGFGVNSDLFKR